MATFMSRLDQKEFTISSERQAYLDMEGREHLNHGLDLLSDGNAELDSDSSSGTDISETEEEVPIDIFSGHIPAMPSDIASVETAIAKELAALSAEAREKAYMDMHGVPDSMNESSELIQQSLAELQTEIDSIRDKSAYDLAWNTDRTYVEDEDFRARFLRADEMDARKAALRIVRHFQVKLDLFGPDKLAMAITQDDLNKEDMEALYSGRARILPTKDRAGRVVNLSFAGKRFNSESIMRRVFYNAMSDPNLHSNECGVVAVIYGVGEEVRPDPELFWKLPKIQDALPMRLAAVHMCQTRSLHSSFFAYITMAFNAFTRIRIRMHSGSHDEVMSSLRGYGIDPESLPIDSNGTLSGLEDYRQSLMLRRARERLRYPRRQRIYVPSIFDVLFGKGTPFQEHSGNKRFRTLIGEQYKKYEKAGRGEKLRVAQEIVDTINQNAGMFLKPDNGTWISVDNAAARSKVSSTFRTMRKMSKDRSALGHGPAKI